MAQLPTAMTREIEPSFLHLGPASAHPSSPASGGRSGRHHSGRRILHSRRHQAGLRRPKNLCEGSSKILRLDWNHREKAIVFSDALNVDRCLEYKEVAEKAGFAPSFGVGTFFTNDFVHKSDGKKSAPLNNVIKLSRAGGRPAIKLSDNMGKNTGDAETVAEVKARLGYVERDWQQGDEGGRWGRDGD